LNEPFIGYLTCMILRRVARPMLASIFVWGGVNALRNLEHHTKTAEPFLTRTVGSVVDDSPDPATVVKVDAVAKIVAGLAFGLGRFPRLSALVLTGSLVPTTLATHAFWEFENPQERATQQLQFLKNLGLVGGLLLASADTHGKPSLGWRARRGAAKVGARAQELTEAVGSRLS
jgi:putative oxidoreductase